MLFNHLKQRNFRIAIVAVTLFLVFDFLSLALNFWLSWKIDKDAVEINLAGRQRMLSQRMVKTLLQLEEAREKGLDPTPYQTELKLTFMLFDDTLQGFVQGHSTKGSDGDTIFLGPVKSNAAKQWVTQASDLWAPYRALVLGVINAGPADMDTALKPASSYAQQHNLQLLDLMNLLTTELERKTQNESRQIRIYQSAAFVIALLNFLIALLVSTRRIRVIVKDHSLLDDIINKISACVIVVGKSDVILKTNHTAEQLFGYVEGELTGHRIEALLQVKDGRLIAHRKDGTIFPASQERDEVMMDGQVLYINTVIDITRQRMTEEHLTSLAYHDLLTGLPNRLLFDDRLHLELAHAQRSRLMLGVLFIDLDHFKPINDTYGHNMGDLLLKEITARLKRCLREDDTVSRRGGDEFTVILSEIGSRHNCEKIAQVILTQLAKPMQIDHFRIAVGASIGISLFPGNGKDGPQLISCADEAMYRAKQAGGNTYRFYSEDEADLAAVQV